MLRVSICTSLSFTMILLKQILKNNRRELLFLSVRIGTKKIGKEHILETILLYNPSDYDEYNRKNWHECKLEADKSIRY